MCMGQLGIIAWFVSEMSTVAPSPRIAYSELLSSLSRVREIYCRVFFRMTICMLNRIHNLLVEKENYSFRRV